MSLIAHYKLDGNANDALGKYNGTASNVTWVDGKLGKAGSFNGSNINLSNHPVRETGKFSLAFWVAPRSTTTGCFFCARTVLGKGLSVFYLNGTIRFDFGNQWTTSVSLDNDQWNHIVLTRSGNTKIIYKNGVFKGSTTFVDLTDFNPALATIGCSQVNGSNYDNYFDGLIDDVRIYDHALSEREVRDLSQGLVLHYTFDQFQEPTENKASGITYSSYAPYHNISGDANKVTMVCATTNIYMTIAGFGTLQGKTITVSGYMKKNGVSYLPPLDKTSTYETATAVKHVMDSSTGRFEVTQVYDSTSEWLFHTPITAVAGDVITIEEFQVEFNKGYATPFVNGTRAGIVRDQSTQGNDAPLALANTPKWVEGGMVGKGCYEFDGVNDYIDISSKIKDIRFDRGFTLSCWAFPTIVSSWARFLDIGVGQQNNNIVFSRYSTTNQLFFEVKNGTSSGTVISGGSIPLNSWSFLTVTVSESMSTVLYINGVQVATGTSTSPQNVSRSSSFIAKSNWSWDSFYKGQIDDIRIYTTALTPEEIKEIYQQRASLDSGGNLLC